MSEMSFSLCFCCTDLSLSRVYDNRQFRVMRGSVTFLFFCLDFFFSEMPHWLSSNLPNNKTVPTNLSSSVLHFCIFAAVLAGVSSWPCEWGVGWCARTWETVSDAVEFLLVRSLFYLRRIHVTFRGVARCLPSHCLRWNQKTNEFEGNLPSSLAALCFLAPIWTDRGLAKKAASLSSCGSRFVRIIIRLLEIGLCPKNSENHMESLLSYSAHLIQNLPKPKDFHSVLFVRIKRDPPLLPEMPTVCVRLRSASARGGD